MESRFRAMAATGRGRRIPKADPVARHAWWSKLSTWWSKLWRSRGDVPAEVQGPSGGPARSPSTPARLPLDAGDLRLRVASRLHHGQRARAQRRQFLRSGPPLAPQHAQLDGPVGPTANGHAPPIRSTPRPSIYHRRIDGPAYPLVFIVADGMGGQQAGEKASQMAVELIPRELAKRIESDADDKSSQRAIREAVAATNQEILALSHLGADYANMGTTVVIAWFHNSRVYVAGIGDSRAYRLRDGKIEQLTRDHSLANALGEAGTIRPDEVENHKFKHVLYLYLGSKDARDGPEEVKALDTRPGDQFLLASDGLTGVVRDELITEVLRTCDDPQRAAELLIQRALENRSKDNITCVVIQVVEASGRAATAS